MADTEVDMEDAIHMRGWWGRTVDMSYQHVPS